MIEYKKCEILLNGDTGVYSKVDPYEFAHYFKGCLVGYPNHPYEIREENKVLIDMIEYLCYNEEEDIDVLIEYDYTVITIKDHLDGLVHKYYVIRDGSYHARCELVMKTKDGIVTITEQSKVKYHVKYL